MQKLAADRRVTLTPEVTRYLTERLQRSFAIAERTILLMDRASLEKKRRLTKPLARALMDRIEGGEAQ